MHPAHPAHPATTHPATVLMHHPLVSLLSLTHGACRPSTRNVALTRHCQRHGHAAWCWKPCARLACRASASAKDNDDATTEVVVGIDLGTTNSAIAVIQDGEPVVVPNKHGDLITPSVVAYLPDGQVLIGKEAVQQSAQNPENTFYSVKRLIGRDYEEVEDLVSKLAYPIDEDDDGCVVLPCPHAPGGQVYPEEISAQIIMQLLADAVAYTGGAGIRKAVVSVPAYFNDIQREETVTAGLVAGLDTVRLVREPVAAALAYGIDVTQDCSVLVFDLGGGTFDVSILEVGGGVIEVLATGGDMTLGGDDWDNAIMSWLIKEHLKPLGVDVQRPALRARLRAVAEAAKRRLSTSKQVTIQIPLGKRKPAVEVVLTAAKLDSLTTPLYQRARFPIEEACFQAGIDLGTATGLPPPESAKKRKTATTQGSQLRPKRRLPITKVLLVGGATRLPGVAPFLRNMAGVDPTASTVDPDLAVAMGAAVQAGMLEGSVDRLMVFDVWQAALTRALATATLKSSQDIATQYLDAEDVEAMGGAEWEVVEDPDDVLLEDEEGDKGRKQRAQDGVE